MLANEATKLLYNEKISKKAEMTAKETFGSKKISKNLPEINVDRKIINKGISILDLFTENKILPSKSEVRRAIANNGIKINDKILNDEKKILFINDFQDNDYIKISFGKKRHYLLKIN